MPLTVGTFVETHVTLVVRRDPSVAVNKPKAMTAPVDVVVELLLPNGCDTLAVLDVVDREVLEVIDCVGSCELWIICVVEGFVAVVSTERGDIGTNRPWRSILRQPIFGSSRL